MRLLDKFALLIKRCAVNKLPNEPFDDELTEFFTEDMIMELEDMEVDEIGAPDFEDDLEMLEKDLEECEEESKSILSISDVPKKAVEWAIKIAKDNKYHYGRSSWAHKYGCPFCKTEGEKRKAAPKSQKSETDNTWCCNPFIAAAYVHGAKLDKKCGKGGATVPLAGGSSKWLKKKGFKKHSRPEKKSELQLGDILLTDTHAMLYAGDGKIVHAAHHDNGPKDKEKWNDSIKYCTLPDSQWKRIKEVWRYKK